MIGDPAAGPIAMRSGEVSPTNTKAQVATTNIRLDTTGQEMTRRKNRARHVAIAFAR